MEVNLINKPGPWSCNITLRFEYDSSGQPLKDALLVPFMSDLTSSHEVEITLMQAQAAVLNYPATPHTTFLTKSRDELEEYRTAAAFEKGTLKFSKNVVCVEVYDESCSDLSFVDLPGTLL